MEDRRGGMGSWGKLARTPSALWIAVESDGILRHKPSIPEQKSSNYWTGGGIESVVVMLMKTGDSGMMLMTTSFEHLLCTKCCWRHCTFNPHNKQLRPRTALLATEGLCTKEGSKLKQKQQGLPW